MPVYSDKYKEIQARNNDIWDLRDKHGWSAAKIAKKLNISKTVAHNVIYSGGTLYYIVECLCPNQISLGCLKEYTAKLPYKNIGPHKRLRKTCWPCRAKQHEYKPDEE